MVNAIEFCPLSIWTAAIAHTARLFAANYPAQFKNYIRLASMARTLFFITVPSCPIRFPA